MTLRRETTVTETWHPKDDSITHYNLYSKGRSTLGRMLTNFTHSPFKHPLLGKFESTEGLHYFLKTGRNFQEFRTLWGYNCKQRGVELSREHMVLDLHFDWMFRIGLVAKITQNPELFEMFINSDLPFTHYYYYGDPFSLDKCKVVPTKGTGTLVTDLEDIRVFLKAGHTGLIGKR